MQPIRDIGESRYGFPVCERRANLLLDVDVGHQFPVAQIFDRLVATAAIDAIGDALATAALVEAEHKSGLVSGPSVMVRINAQASPPSDQQSLPARDEIESGM